jgi:hypothetical protein
MPLDCIPVAETILVSDKLDLELCARLARFSSLYVRSGVRLAVETMTRIRGGLKRNGQPNSLHYKDLVQIGCSSLVLRNLDLAGPPLVPSRLPGATSQINHENAEGSLPRTAGQ